MTRSELGCLLLATVAVLLALLSAAQHDERRSDPLLIQAQATQQPGLCYPLPTPIDRPKRALGAKLGDA